jgi:hypothetical protein
MDLCVCESEEREHGVGAGVNATIMSDVLYGIGLAKSASALPIANLHFLVFVFCLDPQC